MSGDGILERPPPGEMTFAQRLFWLNEDIFGSSNGMFNVNDGGSQVLSINSATGGPRMQEQHMGQLKHHIQQAEECLALAESGQGGTSDTPCNVSERDRAAREGKGLPIEPLPKKDAVSAFMLVLKAKSALAEHLEGIKRYAEALPVYHQTLNYAHRKNKAGTVWVDNETIVTLMMNLGLCYKRAKLYNRAQDWYDRCRQIMEPRDADEQLRNNQHWLNVARSEDPHPAVPPVCWACGKNARVTPNIRLLACARCNAEGKDDVAMYCDANCQKRDWKHHRQVGHST